MTDINYYLHQRNKLADNSLTCFIDWLDAISLFYNKFLYFAIIK